jgi:hypothetical protein
VIRREILAREIRWKWTHDRIFAENLVNVRPRLSRLPDVHINALLPFASALVRASSKGSDPEASVSVRDLRRQVLEQDWARRGAVVREGHEICLGRPAVERRSKTPRRQARPMRSALSLTPQVILGRSLVLLCQVLISTSLSFSIHLR